MRSIRRFSQLLLTILGAMVVIFAMVSVEPIRERILITAFGLFVMELGIWQVTSFLFPNQREYKPLRKETDFFLQLVRRLNRAAVATERGSANAAEEMDRVQEEMQHSIVRMRRLAGQSDEAVAAARVVAQVQA